MKQLIEAKNYADALKLYRQGSDHVTEISSALAIKACTLAQRREDGIEIHQQLSQQALQNPFIQSSLIHFYMQCHDIDSAQKIFSNVERQNIYMCGAMFKGYITNGKPEKVLELFHQMVLKPDAVILTILFNACAKLNNDQAKETGREVLRQMPENFYDHEKLVNSAIDMLMKFGDVGEAERLFHSMRNKTIATYGIMVKGYATNNTPDKALDLFERLPLEPNGFFYAHMYNACALLCNERAINVGQKLLDEMPRKYIKDIIVTTAAIDMMMKFGNVNKAEQLFQLVQKKNIVMYGAMMKGYLVNNLPEKVLDMVDNIGLELNEVLYGIVFDACSSLSNERAVGLGQKLVDQMPKKYLTDHIVISSAIRMLMKFGDEAQAESLSSKVKFSALVLYNAMIQSYNSIHQPSKAIQILERIKEENLVLDEVTSISLIKACAQMGLLSTCQRVIECIPPNIRNIPRVMGTLIDMWGKAGDVRRAEELFYSISSPNLNNYSSMIHAYGRNGMGAEAIDLYHRVPENVRNAVMHVSVLNACSHAGLIDQAQSIFNQIERKNAAIVGVMVDCYARMVMFDQAQALITEYEQSNPPEKIMYMALLSGARNHHRTHLAQTLYDRMETLFPTEKSFLIAASILVSNTYSSVGDYEKSQAIRKDRIKHYGHKVVPGLTWTEVNHEIVEFRAHAHRHHPRATEIQVEIERMAQDLRENGHKYDASWIIRPFKDDENIESVLCGHSEKLAIAYNFIQKPPPSVIQITKNLRVSGDCHAATKLIAKIRQVEIIVRDANRIHHFDKNGQCSCQDHF